jgi:hypothetical protein
MLFYHRPLKSNDFFHQYLLLPPHRFWIALLRLCDWCCDETNTGTFHDHLATQATAPRIVPFERKSFLGCSPAPWAFPRYL